VHFQTNIIIKTNELNITVDSLNLKRIFSWYAKAKASDMLNFSPNIRPGMLINVTLKNVM